MTTQIPLQPKLRVFSGDYEATVPIDGYAVRVLITRMTLDQWTDISNGFQRAMNPEWSRLVSTRLPGEEQEKRDDRFVVSDAEIARRRVAEMTPDERAAYDAMRLAEEAFGKAFITDSITRYVTVLPGQIEEVDRETGAARDITTGADLVRLYGARRDVLQGLIRSIVAENALSEPLKNAFASRSDSPRSSDGPEAAVAHGGTPEAPAPNVGVAPSATSAVATVETAASQSGSQTTERY